MFLLLKLYKIGPYILHRLNVHNAFLHGDLHEEVCMKPRLGFWWLGKHFVCWLQKSSYGLKQASHNWFEKCSSGLHLVSFKQFYCNYSLFSSIIKSSIYAILVHVDDIIITYNNDLAIKAPKGFLHNCFHIRDLEILKYFLRIEVTRSSKGIFYLNENLP